jgi:hypothetical protein
MATEETGITNMALTTRRPDGPKRLGRTPTHEERPAGPRARLSREAGAYLRDRVHRPSGRRWTAHDGRDEPREQRYAQYHTQCCDRPSPTRPHRSSPLGIPTKSAAPVGGGVVLIIAYTADYRPRDALRGALGRWGVP